MEKAKKEGNRDCCILATVFWNELNNIYKPMPSVIVCKTCRVEQSWGKGLLSKVGPIRVSKFLCNVGCEPSLVPVTQSPPTVPHFIHVEICYDKVIYIDMFGIQIVINEAEIDRAASKLIFE